MSPFGMGGDRPAAPRRCGSLDTIETVGTVGGIGGIAPAVDRRGHPQR
ncbi:hypothetical protein [Streptomyces flavofungini]|nr:hypothetical protein [Streptomyces flavofungini]WJV50889.1 hypothetical protein QUY26_38515 [Streptomyces flavofungini]